MRSAEAPAGEPVAVIGLGCRLPGAHGPDRLWRLLTEAIDAVREVPADRFDIDAYYAPRPAPPGRTDSRWGGFVDQVAEFDAEFFGVPADEAAHLDPQQRLLLMTAWEALEDAGQLPDRLAGSRTAVYVGQSHTDYWDLQAGRLAGLGLPTLTGSQQRAMTAGRLSYAFDLRGASVTVDSAQSSAGVAVHLAAQGLRAGDADLALVAGVNLVLSPTPAVLFGQAGVLAADGRCKFGDAGADGFVRSDGIVVAVLKPLSAALADGDRVRAVLLGSGVSNDGRAKPSLTAPSVTGQVAAMRAAYRAAGIAPSEVDYVEAHGTGTRIDQVELAALTEVLGTDRPAGRPCLVGSIKTNIGHTEAAAGLAGLVKTVLCLEHATVPPSLHHRVPHPDVDWARVPLLVPDTSRPLPGRDGRHLAAVNGQSISGTNTHLVLASASPRPPTPAPVPGQTHTLVLSARDPVGLRALAEAYAVFLEPGGAGRTAALRDICHSTNDRRVRHPHQLAVSGTSHAELGGRLRDHLRGERPTGVGAPPPARPSVDPAARLVSLPLRPWRTSSHWLDVAAPPTPVPVS
ncbi:beta-ketoacyl synthase N-terminal-like domain-containing protein [Plantactinospora endophytica]|uniref:beta-ketoacyl synthase N-terminal-like domain-containing protein n=1 Tax=Plantactinospora endophytica TaxID=673535 RepID=UPI0019446153|nr:polyketide synthase [Plantactinospora endophytica]